MMKFGYRRIELDDDKYGLENDELEKMAKREHKYIGKGNKKYSNQTEER